MSRIVCFGEIMMRLNPEGYRRFLQADCFESTYAGGEPTSRCPWPATVTTRPM